MAGLAAIESKVAGCRDQALSKMILPQPVHHHASEQWVVRMCHPVGEFPATIRIAGIRSKSEVRRTSSHGTQSGWRNFIGRTADVAAIQDHGDPGIV